MFYSWCSGGKRLSTVICPMPRPHVSRYFLFVLFFCSQEEGVLISGTNAKTQVFENSPPQSGVLWKRRIVVFMWTHENRGLRANDLMSFTAQRILCKGCGYGCIVLEFVLKGKIKSKTNHLITQRVDAYIFKRKKNLRFQKYLNACGRGLGSRSFFSRKLSLLHRLLGLLIETGKKKQTKTK